MTKRQIKFRVWTGNSMEYSIITGLYGTFYVNPESGNGLDPKDSASLSPCNTKYPDDIPLMQFTGLKDRNGREIYEGDIIKTYNSDLAKEKDILAVKYSGSGFVIYNPNCCNVCKNGNGCICNLDEWDNYEVIGNIYEHNHLLK